MKFLGKLSFAIFSKMIFLLVYRQLKKRFYEYIENPDKEVPVLQSKPVIIVGMHRSGTTLLTKLLKESGMYTGFFRGPATDESLFFQTINRAVFKLFHTRWDNARVVSVLREDPDRVDAFSYAIGKLLKSKLFLLYSGVQSISLNTPQHVHTWGWKDPRNTFTLPIWIRLFPEAKILGITRNGIDVAQSLMARSKNGRRSSGFSLKCLTLNGAFSIWEDYNLECKEIKRSRESLFVKFEDLIENTDEVLYQSFEYMGLSYDFETSLNIHTAIDRSRSNAFLSKDPALLNHKFISQSNLMIELGYNETVDG